MKEIRKKYVVCISSSYVRDTQYMYTKDLDDNEFEDFVYDDFSDRWCDMSAVNIFVGIYYAKNEKQACSFAATLTGYDPRTLYAIEII